MVKEILLSQSPIYLNHNGFIRWHIPLATRQVNLSLPDGQDSPANEERHEEDSMREDAVQPITDELKHSTWWWALEVFSMSFTHQNLQGSWWSVYWLNYNVGYY
jgi:hypothetical protein